MANEYEHALIWIVDSVGCPTCYGRIGWEHGEPYEEPVEEPVQDANAIERLADLIYDGCTTDDETAWEVARYLFENGVSFREDQHG